MRFFLILCIIIFSNSALGKERESFLKAPPNISERELKSVEEWRKKFRQLSTDLILKRSHGEYINELIYSEIPYLKQHANNPINWKAWDISQLEKAKQEKKLIFLSIGYSTCHWCHVMERESFNDVEVAKLINQSFIAIKVDREELPHIDSYYSNALEIVKGSAGWPVSVIIDAEGLPVFIDSYIPKEKLKSILKKITQVWLSQPEFLLISAKNIDELIRQKFKVVVDSKNTRLSESFYEEKNKRLIKALDPVYGGFTGDVKFPSEPMLLYALDQLRRADFPELSKLVKLQLDRMINGGVYDHISGGFHRYSTDNSWTVPHYEKMLYNQAQMIRVLSEAYQIYQDEHYRKVAEETIQFVMQTLFQEKKGFYSAVDADFEGEEGGYYLWQKNEIASLIKLKGVDFYQVSHINSVGIVFKRELISDKDRKELVDNLANERRKRGEIHIDKKILTGWNGLMISALVSASESFKNVEYMETAKKVAEHLWNKRFDPQQQTLSRDGGNESNSFLDDYAYLADSFLSLYDYSGDELWLDRAHKLSQKLKFLNHLNDKRDDFTPKQIFSTENNLKGTLLKIKDDELISAAAVAFDVIAKSQHRLGINKFLEKEYNGFLSYMKEQVKADSLEQLYAARSMLNYLKGSSSGKRYFAQAKGELSTSCVKRNEKNCIEMDIQISLKEGWHVNSNKPLQDYLQPTIISGDGDFQVEYPDSKTLKLGFQEKPLSLFEGKFKINLKKYSSSVKPFNISVPLQVCSDSVCLIPEKLGIRF